MMNEVTLVGRLTKDPELRYTNNGTPVANVDLAVKRKFKNQQGEYETDFIRVQIWRRDAENTANYMKKGDILGVSARIQTRSYDGQDGKRVYVTEVVADSVSFIHTNRNNQGQGGQNQNYQNNQNYGNNQGGNYQPRNNNYQNNQQNQNMYQNNPNDGSPFHVDGQAIDISDDDLPF